MSERKCVHHGIQPAIAICSVCREDVCARCHRTMITGYAVCGPCERRIRRAIQTDWEAAEDLGAMAAGFAATAARVIGSPRQFFERLPPIGGWLRPALFGVIAYAIGMWAQFGWSWLLLPEFETLVADANVSEQLSGPAATALLFFAVPFAAPFVFAVHVILLWAALRLFGAMAHWRIVVRIAGYAGAAHVLQLVPPIGEFPLGYLLAVIWLVNVELFGVRRFFPDMNVWASMAAVFVPLFALSLFGI